MSCPGEPMVIVVYSLLQKLYTRGSGFAIDNHNVMLYIIMQGYRKCYGDTNKEGNEGKIKYSELIHSQE